MDERTRLKLLNKDAVATVEIKGSGRGYNYAAIVGYTTEPFEENKKLTGPVYLNLSRETLLDLAKRIKESEKTNKTKDKWKSIRLNRLKKRSNNS